MFCEQYKKELTDAALGLLGPQNESVIREHLALCEQCRAEFEERTHLIRAMDREIEAMVAAEPSPAFRARVRQRVEKLRLASGWWLPRWALVGGAAMAVLALLAVWFVLRGPIAPGSSERIAQNPEHQSKPPMAPTENLKPRLISKPVEARSAQPGKSAFRPKELEVLVEPGQDQAVVELYAAVWSGRVDPALLLIEPAPVVAFPELKIEPLEIEELDGGAKSLDRAPAR